MSWSIAATGKAAEVKEKLDKDFAAVRVTDPNEQETVGLIATAVSQCLSTFDPEKSVTVGAYGYIGYKNWETKEGAYQQVNLTIAP